MTEFTTWRSLVDGAEISDIPDGVVDNFEDADSDPAGPYASGETVSDFYQGSTGSYERTTSDVVEGSKALRDTDDDGTNSMWSVPGDGLPQYLSEGNTVEFLVRNNGSNPVVCLNVEDSASPSAYAFNISNRVEIYKATDLTDLYNSETQLSVGDGGVNEDTWYIGEVVTPTSSDATISFTLFENDNLSKGSQVDSTSAEDNDYAGQPGLGFYRRSSGDNTTIADMIKVV